MIKKLFFTIGFYRFPDITTESMLLTSMEKGEPTLLTRLDKNGNSDVTASPGFIVRFHVLHLKKETFQAKYIIEGEESKADFLDFMASGHATIDVWDSDSLIHLGSTIVPIKNLYRRGREAVQLFIQCPVVDTSLDTSSKAGAFLYMRVANIGFPSGNTYGNIFQNYLLN